MQIPKDVGSRIATAAEGALDPAAITAGAGNDGVAVNGNVIDRFVKGRSFALSAKLILTAISVLTATKTLAVTIVLNSSTVAAMTGAAVVSATRARYRNQQVAGTSTSMAWTDITLSSGSVPATVVATATGTNRTTVEVDYDLSGANQFLRATITADLSNTATDTVVLAAVLVLGGSVEEQAI